MKRVLVEQREDGTLVAHALTSESLFWARNKARAISGLNRSVVHVCLVRESIDIPKEEQALSRTMRTSE